MVVKLRLKVTGKDYVIPMHDIHIHLDATDIRTVTDVKYIVQVGPA